MENLKEGVYFSNLNKGSDLQTRIIVFVLYLPFGIPLLQIMITLDKLLYEYLNFFGSDFLNFGYNYVTEFGYVIIAIAIIIGTGLGPIMYIFFYWDLKNPGVFYFKNSLIVFRNEKEGEIEIPLQMIKRFLLFHQKTVFIKYREGFLSEVELPRDKKPSPLGEFTFKLNEKSIKIGPSLIDELNKKLQ